MAHGGYGKRRVNPAARRSKALAVDKKPKSVSLKNQIRSAERMLRKILPADVREAQEKKLEGLRKQQEIQSRLAVERKIFLRDRKIKFFERRKIERRIRRLEKLQRAPSGQLQDSDIADQLSKLKEDLEYVRFFPKTEKYVALFTGGDDSDMVDRRNKLRKQIKDNLIAAAASGKDLEETGSEDDGLLDLSEDDFFLSGSSSDEADADDEWTDKSTREQASSTSGKAASGMSSDERNQRQISARALMPPPRPTKSFPSSAQARLKTGSSLRKFSTDQRAEVSTSSNTSSGRSGSSFKPRGSSNSSHTGQSSNISSNSDAHKPRRKRRPKKKKHQA
ncbi:rRNA-processing protein EFG1 isoform X1 [Momordica charantia]|uniref:rRNA-processing protein EFG1 n=1 Tax=Momordica charantia TaxID=3673 RepID=A0A6J1D0D0_MOMCH|nr:rRNA-processing protein EFG1 isoform X1 [Momordica charantia]